MGFIDKNVLKNKKELLFAGTLGGAVRPSSGYAFREYKNGQNSVQIYLKTIKINIPST